MMQEQNTPDLDSAGEEDPRKQLWIRAGVAIGLISVLLGGLAVAFPGRLCRKKLLHRPGLSRLPRLRVKPAAMRRPMC